MPQKRETLNRMPYKLVKVSTGYFVENKETGRRYSQDPMTLKNAEAQLRLLMMVERKPKK